MDDLGGMGRLMVFVALGLLLFGGLLWAMGGRLGAMGLGRLPGDIFIRSGNVSCFFPIVTSIVISIILTVVLNIAVRLMNR